MQPSTVGHTSRITWTAAFNKGPGHHKGLDTLLKAVHFPWKQQPSSQEHWLQGSCDLQRGFGARGSEFKLSLWTHRVSWAHYILSTPQTSLSACQMGQIMPASWDCWKERNCFILYLPHWKCLINDSSYYVLFCHFSCFQRNPCYFITNSTELKYMGYKAEGPFLTPFPPLFYMHLSKPCLSTLSIHSFSWLYGVPSCEYTNICVTTPLMNIWVVHNFCSYKYCSNILLSIKCFILI